MLTLQHAPRSRSGRIVWLLEEIGAEYDLQYVDIVYGDGSGRPDARALHPEGKVPALVHDGALVTESLAVALYLSDLFPEAGLGRPVGDAGRGAFLTWLAWCAGEMEPAIFARMYGGGDDPRSQGAFAAVVARIDAALAAGPFLMGEAFTAVDVMVGGALAWARGVMPSNEALDAYLARIADRPANVAARARDEPAAAARAA